jgi:hypothetical protein
VPTWAQAVALRYEPWDLARDGPRLLVHNDGSPGETLSKVLSYLEETP